VKRILTALVLGISLLVASGGFVYAQDFNKGVEAYEKGDYATALREWSALAEQGNAIAQWSLGVMYQNGQGVTQDYKEAV
jgi:TPR repeat protein